MNGSSSGESRGVLVSVAPMRLAVAPRHRLPKSVDDENHNRVVEQAHDWQQAAGKAVFWEMGATVQGAGEGRAYELAGQMASAGEQLGLAHAGAVEVALWREFREKAEPDPEHEMSMRAMAETQCLFVLGTGHALANVTVRALALHPDLRAELINGFENAHLSPTFDPFSQKRDDWVSLNVGTCKKIQAVAQCSDVQELAQLVKPVARFASKKSWQDLLKRRNEDFHRWRPQTHGVEGVPRTSPWKREGRSRSLNIGHPSYEEAQGLADQSARVANEAMLDLAISMEAFMLKWPVASKYLGGPRFKLS